MHRAAGVRVIVGRAMVTWSALMVSGAAWAAETTEHEGMPQLNFANPLTVSQIVWMAVVFLAFYMLVSRWALPMVSNVIEARAASIAGDLEAARGAKADADTAAREVATATRKASAEAQTRIGEAVAQAKAEAAVRAEESNRRLEQLLVSAEEQITAARATAMGALREVASETAASVVYRLTGRSSEPALIDEAVGAAIAARAG